MSSQTRFKNHPARLAAIAAGEPSFVGMPCLHGHNSRSVAHGRCQACDRLQRKVARVRELKRSPYLRELAEKREAFKAAKLAAKLAAKSETEPKEPDNSKLIKINAKYVRLLMTEKLQSIRNEKSMSHD